MCRGAGTPPAERPMMAAAVAPVARARNALRPSAPTSSMSAFAIWSASGARTWDDAAGAKHEAPPIRVPTTRKRDDWKDLMIF